MYYFLVPLADRRYRSSSPFGYVTVWARRNPSLLELVVKCTFCGSRHCEHSLLAVLRCMILCPEYFVKDVQGEQGLAGAVEEELSSGSEADSTGEDATNLGDLPLVFPYSAEVICQLAQEESRHWRTSILDPRLHTAPSLDSYPGMITPEHTSCIFRGCGEELGPPVCVNQNAKIIGGLLGMREGMRFSNFSRDDSLDDWILSPRCVCSDQAVP